MPTTTVPGVGFRSFLFAIDLPGFGTGHFVWEEAPAEYAASIIDSIASE